MEPSNFTNTNSSDLIATAVVKMIPGVFKDANSSSEAMPEIDFDRFNPLKSQAFFTISTLAILSCFAGGFFLCCERIGRRQSVVNVPMANISTEAGGEAQVGEGEGPPPLRGVLTTSPGSAPRPRSSSPPERTGLSV